MVQFINKQRGTKSSQLCYKAWELWQSAIKNNMNLRAAHIAGVANILPDQLSRIKIRPNGMDFEQQGPEMDFSNMGETVNRSICIISEQEDGHLLHLGPPSLSVCCRCFFP